MQKACVICGKTFEPKIKHNKQICCSEECKKERAEYMKRLREERYRKVCVTCGKTFRASSKKQVECDACKRKAARTESRQPIGLPKACASCKYSYTFGSTVYICEYILYTQQPRGISVEECAKKGKGSRYEPSPQKRRGRKRVCEEGLEANQPQNRPKEC